MNRRPQRGARPRDTYSYFRLFLCPRGVLSAKEWKLTGAEGTKEGSLMEKNKVSLKTLRELPTVK